MKKIIKIAVVIVLIITVSIIYISYIDTNNEEYINNLSKTIKQKLNLTEDINYTNQYGNYYIIKTSNEVIVLTKDYREVFKESISKLSPNNNNYALVYKTNKLLYENTIMKKNTLTYEYYDTTTGELVKKTTMEK